MTDWFRRFRIYGWSVAGHIAQGAACGAAAAYGHHWPAGIWAMGYLAYQFGSGARKWAAVGHPDTMGLDTMDFAVGFVPGYAITRIALALLAGG